MAYLIDTNVLLRSIQSAHPMHQLAVDALTELVAQAQQLYILPQTIHEFWNVATRPANKNGLGMTPTQAEAEVQRIEALFPLLEENLLVYRQWRHLVANFQVAGVQVHDANLVAAMTVHGITHLLTFNAADFARYNLHILDPASRTT